MSANAITVKDVTKVYRLYDKPIDRLKESLSPTHKSYHKDFYALNGLSFNVEKGQTVGIIGTNGSGKSTILKIITGVLTPTTGQVDVEGKISALLELGAGFNMDYTGIENIYMNGTMMGYSRKEMDEKLQDILDFAEMVPVSAQNGENVDDLIEDGLKRGRVLDAAEDSIRAENDALIAETEADIEHLKSLIEQAEARIEDSKQKTSDSSAAIQKEKEAISQLLEFANGVAGKEGAQ